MAKNSVRPSYVVGGAAAPFFPLCFHQSCQLLRARVGSQDRLLRA